MGWDSIGAARASLSDAVNTHKLLLENDGTPTQEYVRAVALDVAEKLLHAQEAMSSAYDERSNLYDEIRSLSSAFEKRADIVKHLDGYYLQEANGKPTGDPYCLVCWERNYTLLHLIRKSSETNRCPFCDCEYMATSTPFGVEGDAK